jgi:hypothetical protein
VEWAERPRCYSRSGGAAVIVVGRRADLLDQVVNQIEDAGGQALAVPGDVSDAGRSSWSATRLGPRWRVCAAGAGRRGRPAACRGVSVSPITDFTLSGQSISTNQGKDVNCRDEAITARATHPAGADPAISPAPPLFGDPTGLPPLLIACGGDELSRDECRRSSDASRRPTGPAPTTSASTRGSRRDIVTGRLGSERGGGRC